MADINTESSKSGFIFGQNMEERVMKSPGSTDGSSGEQGDGEGGSPRPEAGEDGGYTDGDRPLLRPSTFLASPAHGQGMVASEAISNNPFAVSSPCYPDSDDEKKDKPIVAPSHFTPTGAFGARGFGFCSNLTPTSNRMLLKPSTLDKQTVNFNKENCSGGNFRTSFKLEPAKLMNPFYKTEEKDGSPEKTSSQDSDKTIESSAPSSTPSTLPSSTPSEPSQELHERLQEPVRDAAAPAAENNSTPAQNTFTAAPAATKCSGGFVFGQNMQHRVFGAESGTAEGLDEPGGFIFGQSGSERVVSPTSNGTAQSPTEDGATAENPVESPDSDKTKSLMESAAAHQARLARPEFEEVEVKTGEEDESNVFQINVKLFLFDKDNQTWIEKGRGQLRLNDMTFSNSRAFQSRVVMRTQGSLRVIMNTKVWAGMLVEMASEKSVRITAVGQDEGIKIYLIMASRSDASHIYSAINSRVQQLRAEEMKERPDGIVVTDGTQEMSQSQSQPLPAESTSDKRKSTGSSPEDQPSKRPKTTRHNIKSEESNDSSTVDPETEASNESCASSPNVKSSSSE